MKWDEYFLYDEESPSCLRWKVKPSYARRVSVGNCAGGISDGRWKVGLNGKHYQVSRVIYEMFHGEIHGEMVVDHLDKNQLNNRLENLRAVPQLVNMRNRSRNVDNTSGHTGVCINEKTHGDFYAVAQWTDLSGKNKSKSFSFKKYGEELALLCAVEAREQAIRLLNQHGAGYSETHGK